MNPEQTQNFRGPDYYHNLNTSFSNTPPANIPASSAVSSPIPTVSTPTTVNASAFSNPQSFTTPTVPVTGYGSLIHSLQAGVQPLEQQANQQSSALDQQLQDVLNTQTQLGNAGTEYSNFLASPELKAQQKALADTNMQFTQARNAFQLQNQDTQNQPGSYTQFASALLSRDQQKQAITLGNLAAVSQTLQGNIDAAKATVKETIEAKYKPLEAQLEAKKFFYSENKDKFTATQKRLADKQDKLLDIQLRKIQSDKEDARHNADNALALLKEGKIDGTKAADIMSGKLSISSALRNTAINAATALGSDPLTALQTIIKSGDGKSGDKLKLTGAVIAATQKFAQNNPTGDFKGLGPIRAGNLTVSQSGQNNRTYLAGLKGTVESWMTGASVSDDQQSRIEKDLIPKEGDTDKQVRQKINALTNYMLDYASGDLATQGINYRPTQIDLFTVKTDPLNLGIGSMHLMESNPLGI